MSLAPLCSFVCSVSSVVVVIVVFVFYFYFNVAVLEFRLQGACCVGALYVLFGFVVAGWKPMVT